MEEPIRGHSDAHAVAEWAGRIAWRSTGIVVVAGKLDCDYWKILRHHNSGVTVILFDPDRTTNFDAEKEHNIVGCSNLHDLGVLVASRYKVPWRVEVIGSDDVRQRFGADISETVDRAVRGVMEAEHTTRVNADKWLTLGLRALVEMSGERALNGAPRFLEGETAVIVGAGPSLDRNIKVLAEYQDKVVIFATDAVVKPLFKAGIRPHFIVTVEANGRPTKATQQNPLWRDAVIIPGVHAADNVWKFRPRRWLWGVQLVGPVGPFVVEGLGLPLLRSGGSVSTIAYSAAVSLGASQVVLIGMDSAVAHDGAFYGANVAFKHARKEVSFTKCVAYGGIGYVDAPRQLCSYREWFEARAHEARASGAPLINATEGGARIEGTVEVPLLQAIGGIDRANSVPIMDRILRGIDDAPVIDTAKLLPALKEERERAVGVAEKAADAAQSMGNAYKRVDEMLNLPKANILFRSAVGPIQEAGMMPRGNEMLTGQKILDRVATKQVELDKLLCDTIKKLEDKHD